MRYGRPSHVCVVGSRDPTVTRSDVLSFFFQAEDGIRDWSVTGVQTCALPILTGCSSSKVSRANLVPFTKDLRQKLEKENIDLKQVQFYIDQKLILDRNLGDQKEIGRASCRERV